MKKYGIDIFDEWWNVSAKGVKFFNDITMAIDWGKKNTHEDDPVAYGFFIFEGSDNSDGRVVYHSSSGHIDPIESRFEILDL